jgi:hypothetical protein
MDSSRATYSVFKDFSNLASNSVKYSRFLIESLLLIHSGESIFPVFFTMESCDSLHHFGGESPFVSIICINSRLSFNTESQYSPYWLLRRVTTPLLIYSGESLLTVESYFQKLRGIPSSFKGTMKQKWTIHVEYCSPRTFQKSHCNWQRGVNFLII